MPQEQIENILFVDDEESILDVTKEYFELKGLQIFTAKNGLEAIDILNKERIDCCFTDINMPGMDGLELAEHINKNDITIPVVIMTGYPSLKNIIQTMKNGVVDYLIKPVNLDQIELCIKRVFVQRKLFIENILLKKEVEGKTRLEKLNQELFKKIQELNILNKIMSELATIRSSSEVFKGLVEMAVEITHADEAVFYIVNGSLDQPKPLEIVTFEKKSEETHSKGSKNIDPIFQNPRHDIKGRNLDPNIEKLIVETAIDKLPILIKKNKHAEGIPEWIHSFIVVPLKIRGKILGVLTTAITTNKRHFHDKDLYYLSFMAHNAGYSIENLALYENIYDTLFSTLFAFVKTIEAKDPYTKQHSNRVTHIANKLAKEMGCSDEEIDILTTASLLHDIGKIGVSDDILLKPSTLTEDEYKKVKEHPALGASIVGQLGLWKREQQIIKSHHERIDGKGYPDGIKGQNIPFLARILSVADVYDSMVSDRSYRKKMAENQVISSITKEAGAQFDPDVVAVFLKLHNKGIISSNLNDSLQN